MTVKNLSPIGTERLTQWLENHPNETIKKTYLNLTCRNWSFVVARLDRGFCSYRRRTIVIPYWIFDKSYTKMTWYCAHEMAHAIAGYHAKHGRDFMIVLKTICPIDCQYHEYGYKPRNALLGGLEVNLD